MSPRLLVAASVLFALIPQQSNPRTPLPESQQNESEYFRLQRELASWRTRFGESWDVVFDHETGRGRFLFGGARALGFTPLGDDEYFVAARSVIAETRAIHGLDPATLVDEEVMLLPLSLAGTTDKMTVQFRQEVGGVRVLGGYANVLFDLAGRVLAVDATGMPELAADFDVAPAVGGDEARERAVAAFAADTGLRATRVERPELAIAQLRPVKLREARLVWQVEVHYAEPGFEPEGFTYRVDAQSGAIVERAPAVFFDVSGQVKSNATPGSFPDSSSNPETAQAMPYLRVTSSQGNATTDANGNFTIVGASAPLNVGMQYLGTYCDSNNQAGSDYSLSTTLNSASGNVVTMNPASATFTTAEANAFLWIAKMRDWTRSVNASDATSDFLATSNPNLSQTCNAFYDGVSVNFYQAGGGCANTAFSSVVLHEMGHWLNTRYSSGNGSDGFGEGNADNFSTFILEDPIVGHNFCGTNCNVRDANNNRQFCGDCCGGCYGEVHADGEVLMGALWKVRTRMKTKYGAAAGAANTNLLFNAWMNAFNDTQIKSIIETHWLVLNDNNGNVNDGTPDFNEIDGGFRQQGFPGYVTQSVSYGAVTQLANTPDENGPYTVSAAIFANTNPPIASASLRYRVDGGSFATVPMSFGGGNSWSGGIPGIQSPAKVEYYVTATDSAAHSATYPATAPSAVLAFKIGVETVNWSEGFESGTNGWTHGQIAVQDDWQLSSQQGGVGANGESGDPTAAYAGQNIWGNDLGFGSNNGAYSNDVSNWLRSPAINLAGKTRCTLRFQRWLTVESGQYDQAKVKVNGTQVWINDPLIDTLDTAWTPTEIDISALADNNPSVQLEFSLASDVGLTYGGWNIDALEIVSLTASPGCNAPTASAPGGQVLCPGATATFTTTATGDQPLLYQWKKNTQPIAGATSPTYVIGSVAAGDAGSFTCAVSNGCGSVESAPAVLTVNTATSASTPANQTACQGGPASFSTTPAGTGPFTYQWKKNGAMIGGATSSSLALSNVQPADAGTYSVVVTGACGFVEPAATLTVNTTTTASTPASQTVCAGGTAGFSTTAGGTGPFTYQWKKNGGAIPGATGASYSVVNAQAGDAGTYSVLVTGACSFAEPAASLTVNAATTATTPSSQTVCPGAAVGFSTVASGTGPFAYQWKKNGSPIGGATGASYSIASAQASDAGTYSVVVTGACNFVEPSASLAVNTATSASNPQSFTVCPSAQVVFATTASGTGPFAYQWKKNGAAISGATGASYTISSVQVSDAGTYSVVVTGACNFVEPSGTLTLNAPVSATTPADQGVCPGAGASFSTTPGGTGPFSYQWKKDGVSIPGAHGSSYSIASVQPADAGTYSVLVAGACGTTEPAAQLTVQTTVTATTPASLAVCAGDPAVFSTTAGGTGPFVYQWKKDGVSIPGATAASFAIASAQAADAGTYSVLVTGACGTIEPSATLAVNGVVASYCTSKTTSTGSLPVIASTGHPSDSADDFVVTLSGGVPNKTALAFWGTQQSGAPFNGGFLCVQPPLVRLSLVTIDAGGSTSIPIPIDATMVGATRDYQWWFRDPADPFTIGLSNALTVRFCD